MERRGNGGNCERISRDNTPLSTRLRPGWTRTENRLPRGSFAVGRRFYCPRFGAASTLGSPVRNLMKSPSLLIVGENRPVFRVDRPAGRSSGSIQDHATNPAPDPGVSRTAVVPSDFPLLLARKVAWQAGLRRCGLVVVTHVAPRVPKRATRARADRRQTDTRVATVARGGAEDRSAGEPTRVDTPRTRCYRSRPFASPTAAARLGTIFLRPSPGDLR